MLTLTPATMADAERLFAWRNDPESRRQSFSTGEVAWADHVAWLERVLADPDRRLFVGSDDGRAVGQARGDRAEEGWELSITVAPDQRGKGYGTALVKAALNDLDGTVVTLIKADNTASLRMVEQAGFSLVDTTTHDGVECVEYRFVRPARTARTGSRPRNCRPPA